MKEMEDMDSEIIFEEWSPFGNIQAFVEKTERTYYFYLCINPESTEPQIRSCWICNRINAPRNVKELPRNTGLFFAVKSTYTRVPIPAPKRAAPMLMLTSPTLS